MEKYITDTLHNSLRSITADCTRPQQKAVAEVLRGLFTGGEPVLYRLAQNPDCTAKKQGEKYGYHLGNVRLTERVEQYALRTVRPSVRQDAVIAYDITDLSQEYAETMESIGTVWDGSRHATGPGFLLHGIGVNGTLLTLRRHDGDGHTEPQMRFALIGQVSRALDGKGIWVFDRGNDSREFFHDLRHTLGVRFVARIKDNRKVALVQTGEVVPVDELPEGRYAVHLLGAHPGQIDPDVWLLVVHRRTEEALPLRLLTNLPWQHSSDAQIATLYCKRWGVENSFRSAKTCFGLEKIRVQRLQRLENLLALVHLAFVLATKLFHAVQQSTHTLVVAVLRCYEQFLRLRSLTVNADSFVRFLRQTLPPLVHRERPPPMQQRLFSPVTLLKLA